MEDDLPAAADPRPPQNPDELRMYAVVPKTVVPVFRREIGKLSAQTGHAFMFAYWDAELRHPAAAAEYRAAKSAAKVTLVAADENELAMLHAEYGPNYGVAYITDEGRTVFNVPTVTALGIGPISWNQCGPSLRNLKSLRGRK